MQSCHVCQKQIACNEEESIYGHITPSSIAFLLQWIFAQYFVKQMHKKKRRQKRQLELIVSHLPKDYLTTIFDDYLVRT